MKTPIYNSPWLQVLSQAGMILILAATLGMLVNQVRPGELPLWVKKGSVKQVPDVEPPLLITLHEAEARYLRHSALFLDARSPEVYRQAHILGARNLPWESFEKDIDAVMAGIPRDRFIIAYGDGVTLSVSGALASALASRGYKEVRVLVNGWNLWLADELPIESGAPAHSINLLPAGPHASIPSSRDNTD
jgi:3-mercaptopyruvate sulfurtransferase SseA